MNFKAIYTSRTPRIALTLVSSSVLLTACGLFEKPTPNPALLSLTKIAQEQADSPATNPDMAQLRSEDAAELTAEIERICRAGEEDKPVPESCVVDAATLPDNVNYDPQVSPIVQDLAYVGEVPQASLALVAGQIIDLATAGAAVPAPVQADLNKKANPDIAYADIDEDTAKLIDALNHEYSVIYALGVAQAYSYPGDAATVSGLLDTHHQRVALLLDSLPAEKERPVPAAAYSLTEYGDPTNGEEAQELVSALVSDDAQFWANLASQAHTPSWRKLTVTIAAGDAS